MSLSHKEELVSNLLLGGCHLGTKKVTKQMEGYVYGQNKSGVQVFDVSKQYEKFVLQQE